MWSTPCARATSIVRSVEPSSMISHSTASKPGTSRGRSASVAGSVSSSLRQGIWMMSFMRAGRSDGACRAAIAVHSRCPVSHMASATLTRRPRAGRRAGRAAAPVAGRLGARRAGARHARRVRRLPDLSELRLATTRCCGAASCCTGTCRPSTPTARRPSIRWRSPSARCCRCSGDRADRVMVGATVASFVRARRRHLPPRRRAFTPLVGAGRRRAAVHALRLPVPRRPRLHRHPVPGVRRLGGGARGASARAAAGPSWCCSRCAGLLRPEAWLLAGLYWLWCAWPASWPPARSRYAALAAVGPVVWVAVDFVGHRRPAVLAARTRAGWPRSSGAPRALVAGARRDRAVPHRASQGCRCFYAGDRRASSSRCVLAPRRAGDAAGAVRVGRGDVRARRRSPACRSSTATCSSRRYGDGLRGGGARRLDDAARRAWLRRVWAVGALLLVRLRRRLHRDARQPRTTSTPSSASAATRTRRSSACSHEPGGRARGLRCGPVSTPNHKLVPDARWILDAAADEVVAARRSTAQARRIDRGVAIVRRPTARALLQPGARRPTDDPLDSLPLPGFRARRRLGVLRGVCPLLSGARRRPPRRRAGAGDARARAPLARRGWALARRARPAGARACASGASTTACPTPTTPTRTRTSCRARSGCSATAGTRTTSSTRRPTRTCCTSCFAVWFGGREGVSRRVRARPDRGLRRRARDRRGVLGTLAVWLLLPRRRAARSTAASGCSPRRCWRVAFLPVFYSHLALNDVPTLAPICLALWGAAGVLRCGRVRDYLSRASASAWRARRSTRAGSCCCRCSRRPRRSARARRPRAALRGLVLAGVVGARGVLRRQPVRAARLPRVPRRAAPPVRRPPTTRSASSA